MIQATDILSNTVVLFPEVWNAYPSGRDEIASNCSLVAIKQRN
jgi:hypothetical protein